MAADVWQRVIRHADIVIWCTHATQAWRQSEAAVWASLPPELHARSLLLLTRMDKILSDRDRARVIKRVESETRGLFNAVLPVSLVRALDAQEGSAAWDDSGAADLLIRIDALVAEVASGVAPRLLSQAAPQEQGAAPEPVAEAPAPRAEPARIVMPTRVRPRPLKS
jgi:hypothetical protein